MAGNYAYDNRETADKTFNLIKSTELVHSYSRMQEAKLVW